MDFEIARGVQKGRTARKSGSSFYNRGWRDFGLLFEQRPVAGLAQLGPLLILGVRLELVVVAVRRFLNGEVIPGLRVRVVRPDRHVREEIVLGLGLAVEDAVDERHGLGAGDVVLRADLADAVADNIGEVIRRVQTERIIIGDHDGGRRVGARGVVARPLGVEGDVPGHGQNSQKHFGELRRSPRPLRY